MLAAGGLLLGSGARALAVDGSCAHPADLPGALCPQRFDTSAVGTALVVPAVTLIVLGTTLAVGPATAAPRRTHHGGHNSPSRHGIKCDCGGSCA